MRTCSKVTVLAASLLALSGCQSSPLTSWIFKRSDRAAVQLVAHDGMQSLREGREALQAGRLGQAIGLLRIAEMDPVSRPQASNALGVAYAQLGREDLAERYFRSAIAADPGDQRFVANLVRLQHAMLARKMRSEAAQLAAMHKGEADVAGGFLAAKTQPAGQVAGGIAQRSRGEIFIATGVTQAAPTASVAHLQKPADRIAHADADDAMLPPSRKAIPPARIVENPHGSPVAAPPSTAGRPK